MECIDISVYHLPDCVNAVIYSESLTDDEKVMAKELYDLCKSYVGVYEENIGEHD